jgi:hypothetical protein
LRPLGIPHRQHPRGVAIRMACRGANFCARLACPRTVSTNTCGRVAALPCINKADAARSRRCGHPDAGAMDSVPTHRQHQHGVAIRMACRGANFCARLACPHRQHPGGRVCIDKADAAIGGGAIRMRALWIAPLLTVSTPEALTDGWMLGELSSPMGCCPHVTPAQMVGDHAEPGMWRNM